MHDSTEMVVAPIQRRVGRKRVNAEQGGKLTLRLPDGALERVKAVLRAGEAQSTFLRETVLAEVERREKE